MHVCRVVSKLFLIAGYLSVGACTTANRSGPLTDAIPKKSNNQAAHEANKRGLSLVEQEDFHRAEEAFRDAIQLDFHYAAGHNNLGLVLLKQGKLYEAATELRMAGTLEPRATQPSMNLAFLYERIGWEREAALQRERALDVGKPK